MKYKAKQKLVAITAIVLGALMNVSVVVPILIVRNVTFPSSIAPLVAGVVLCSMVLLSYFAKELISLGVDIYKAL